MQGAPDKNNDLKQNREQVGKEVNDFLATLTNTEVKGVPNWVKERAQQIKDKRIKEPDDVSYKSKYDKCIKVLKKVNPTLIFEYEL